MILFRALRFVEPYVPLALIAIVISMTGAWRSSLRRRRFLPLRQMAEQMLRRIESTQTVDQAYAEVMAANWRVAMAYAVRDRFCTKRWRKRITVELPSDWCRNEACVFAFVHTCGMRLLPAALVAKGIDCGVIVRHLDQSGLPRPQGITYFLESEIRPAICLLRAKGQILIALDGKLSDAQTIDTPIGPVRCSSGCWRIAQAGRATIRPVTIIEERHFRWRIVVGARRVPDDAVSLPDGLADLFNAMIPSITTVPREWDVHLLLAIVGNPVSYKS